eukprot:GGOE01014096.1.p1 GENE.GGOE01014096.1~~GGOE01014096.1.p1  ORF type:complete len:197 (-),score=37.23 GGOE01014096.1:130-720(-)
MGEDELLDVLDENGVPTGVVKSRKDVHANGEWHHAVHTWVVCKPRKTALLQQRAFTKKLFPGCYDISSAGHVKAGHTPLETAIEEMTEELGLQFRCDQFEHIGHLKHIIPILDDATVYKQFVDIFLVELEEEVPQEQFQLQAEEVLQVTWLDWQELKQRFEDKDPTLTCYDEPVKLFLSHLEARWNNVALSPPPSN